MPGEILNTHGQGCPRSVSSDFLDNLRRNSELSDWICFFSPVFFLYPIGLLEIGCLEIGWNETCQRMKRKRIQKRRIASVEFSADRSQPVEFIFFKTELAIVAHAACGCAARERSVNPSGGKS
jgi:hypothetical protein